MRVNIYCPVCAAAGIKRKLMEVEESASGKIYPYCKGCKKNVEIRLAGSSAVGTKSNITVPSATA